MVWLLWQHGLVDGKPMWWRGELPSAPTRDVIPGHLRFEGLVTDMEGVTTTLDDPLQGLGFFGAQVCDVELWLTGVHLSVRWSEFDRCHFRQRTRPILNSAGAAAQGSFGDSPAVYRGCTFERIRFKTLGGFTTGRATFEDCTFLNCRWEGHFAHETQLLGCRFIGRINGCVWGGEPVATDGVAPRPNLITGNDFSRATITDNVGWRRGFPLADQTWPTGYVPVPDR